MSGWRAHFDNDEAKALEQRGIDLAKANGGAPYSRQVRRRMKRTLAKAEDDEAREAKRKGGRRGR